MNYDIYKDVRNTSWQCLIDCKITELPTNLSKICRHNNIQIIKNSKLKHNALQPNQRGKKILIGNQLYIVTRDTDPLPVQRYTIAHELGHILRGNDTAEDEAERFAIGILAPACVLHALEIERAEDIAKLCNISITAASHRAERMKILNQRNAFLKHPLEREVYEQFKPFIKQMRTSSH